MLRPSPNITVSHTFARAKTYFFGVLNCNTLPVHVSSLDFVLLNPGGEHLSTGHQVGSSPLPLTILAGGSALPPREKRQAGGSGSVFKGLQAQSP